LLLFSIVVWLSICSTVVECVYVMSLMESNLTRDYKLENSAPVPLILQA